MVSLANLKAKNNKEATKIQMVVHGVESPLRTVVENGAGEGFSGDQLSP